MAARAAIRAGDIGLLASKAGEESWRETIVFAAGHAQGKQRDQFVARLLKVPFFSLRQRSIEADVTAACCLETAGADLEPSLFAGLRARAQNLFPPRTLRDAKVLAPAASLDPDLLKGQAAKDQEVIAACIRCASIVGGERMLGVIASYANVPGTQVWDELVNAWTAFEADEYLRQVILARGDSNLGGLKLRDLDSDTLKCLQVLVWKGAQEQSSEALTSALQSFIEHRVLALGTNMVDVESDDRDTSIRADREANSARKTKAITEFDAQRLAAITSMRSLNLGTCERGVLPQLVSLPALASLSYGASELTEINSLSQCESLEGLRIHGLGLHRRRLQSTELDLRPLANWPALKRLGLLHFPGDISIRLPVNAQRLELELTYVGLSAISQVRLIPGITLLRIQNKDLPNNELDLTQLGQLTDLNLCVDSPVRIRLPKSITSLRIAQSTDAKVINPEDLVSLDTLSLHAVAGPTLSRDLLELPKLETLFLDDNARENIGFIPPRWKQHGSILYRRA